MKILLLCEHLKGTDGWSRYSKDLSGALRERGHEVVTHCPSSPIGFLTRPYRAFALALELRRLAREYRPDILHIAVEPYALAVPFLPHALADRTVLTIHGSYGVRPLASFRTRWLSLRYYGRIARFITVSRFTALTVGEELKRMGRHALSERFTGRTTVIHNGIRLPSRAHQKSKTIAKKKSILHVGGVKPLKGLLEAVRACAAYKRSYGTSFIFSVIGRIPPDDGYVRTVREEIAALGLSDDMRFRGFVSPEELENAYKEADLFLMPSLTRRQTFEGFGIVYLEANSYGVPCIGPRTGGAAEAIAEEKSGYHADPSNAEEIAERMHRILDEGLIGGDACRAWAEKHDIRDVARRVEEVYRAMR